MTRKKFVHPNQLELGLTFHTEDDDTHDDIPNQEVVVVQSPSTDLPAEDSPAEDSPAEALSAEALAADESLVQEAQLWQDGEWSARVMKNDNDDGWAVEMSRAGETEPALVAPWTMGRDKKNPKPLDAPAFATLVKTASEVLRRKEQQLHAMLHKSITVESGSATFTVTLDIVPDEDNSYATLAAFDENGAQLAQVRVAPTFKLNKRNAVAWIDSDFRRPERS